MRNINWNQLWIGLVLGLVTPLIVYALYYWVVSTFELRRVNVSLCMVANLLPFFLALNREYYNTARGILISTVALAVVVACLSFFTNYLRIL